MHLTKVLFGESKLIMLLAISLLAGGCSVFQGGRSFVPREGDLLFQDMDGGPLCDAIERVTTGYLGAKFTHVGIVAKGDGGNFVVVEARSDGVVVTPLSVFLSRSSDSRQRPKVVVGRLSRRYRHLIPGAIKEAFALKGRAYDKAFVIDNEAYYCSELIYEIFLRANANNPVFILQPMTFNDPDTGSVFPAWQEYFSQLGVAIPEDKPGINPGGISRSPVLSIIHAYGIPDGWDEKTLK